MKDVLGNHLKDRIFHLVHLVEYPSIWKERLTWIVPRIRIVRGGNLEG